MYNQAIKFENITSIKNIKTFGNSMYPLLINGDIVHYRKTAFSKIKVNDLIGFKKNQQIINHRVIYKANNYLLTKGDNNPKSDPKVYPGSIIGLITYITRGKKKIDPENIYLFQSATYLTEINKVNSALMNQNINFVYLKGLPVHIYYAQDYPRRIIADCDVLISQSDIPTLNLIFETLGYQKQNVSLGSHLDKIFVNKTEYSFWKNVGNYKVSFDIHIQPVFFFVQINNISPLYPYRLVKKFTNHLLTTKRSVTLNHIKYPFLTVENQIVYLAMHLFHDNYTGYYKYQFLKKVINYSKFNVQIMTDLVKKYHLENYLYPTFTLLKKYYTPNLLNSFLKNIQPKHSKLKYLQALTKSTNIFNEENRITSAVRRFINIYQISNASPLIKPLIFLKPQILVLVSFSIIKHLSAPGRTKVFSELKSLFSKINQPTK